MPCLSSWPEPSTGRTRQPTRRGCRIGSGRGLARVPCGVKVFPEVFGDYAPDGGRAFLSSHARLRSGVWGFRVRCGPSSFRARRVPAGSGAAALPGLRFLSEWQSGPGKRKARACPPVPPPAGIRCPRGSDARGVPEIKTRRRHRHPAAVVAPRRRLPRVAGCPASPVVQGRRLSRVAGCPGSPVVQGRRLSRVANFPPLGSASLGAGRTWDPDGYGLAHATSAGTIRSCIQTSATSLDPIRPHLLGASGPILEILESLGSHESSALSC
jgi:hypothetical protein